MRLVIFDMDGTLLDSQQHILEAQRTAFTTLGLPVPSREASLSIVGLSLDEAFRTLAGPQAPIERLAEAYKDAWLTLRTAPGFRDALYTGARDLVQDLAARPDTRLAIATGKSRRGVDRVLASQEWRHTFASVQTADTHPSKPHPSMIVAALADTGVAAPAAVMIGDTTFDVEMAVAAGVPAIGVTWGFHPRAALEAAGAAHIVDTFADLRRLLLLPASETAHGQ